MHQFPASLAVKSMPGHSHPVLLREQQHLAVHTALAIYARLVNRAQLISPVNGQTATLSASSMAR